MNLYDATNTLTAMFKAGLKALLVGPPGCGKSDVTAEATSRAEMDLILSHPSVEDPTDVRGIPWVFNGNAVCIPHDPLRRACSAVRPTVWMLEDLGQATSATQAAYMQLILARRLGEHVLSEYVTICAATNRRSDRAGVSGILAPVQDRFDGILEVEPDFESWQTWAATHGIDARLVAYLHMNRDDLYHPRGGDIQGSPSPRTWAAADRMLRSGLDPALSLGQAVGIKLRFFLDNLGSMPDIDEILKTHKVPELSPDLTYAVIVALVGRLKMSTWPDIASIIESLTLTRETWAVLLFKQSMRAIPDLATNGGEPLTRLASGELGKVIFG